LAHGKEKRASSPAEHDKVKTILELYNTLSEENQKRVFAQLADIE
jgi:hypothetical protein